MAEIQAAQLRTIITDPDGAMTLVTTAEQLGRDLKNRGLTTNQIRALFGEVRQIEAQWNTGGENRQLAARRLVLLKPKMAYRARRERGSAVQDLRDVLEPALDLVVQETNSDAQHAHFGRFVEFFEAILAYHKAFGGN